MRVSGFKGLGFRDSELQISLFGFRVPESGFRVSGFICSSFGFQVSGFEFRVIDSDFLVSGFETSRGRRSGISSVLGERRKRRGRRYCEKPGAHRSSRSVHRA